MAQKFITSLFSNILSEAGKVSWPSKQETMKLTLVVIMVSLFVGLYIGLLDIVFAQGLQLFTK